MQVGLKGKEWVPTVGSEPNRSTLGPGDTDLFPSTQPTEPGTKITFKIWT